MRPVPIPDHLVTVHQKRVVVGAPGGDLLNSQVAPVEAVVEHFVGDAPMLSVRLQLEEGDLDSLRANPHIWLRFWGHMVPFEVECEPETT